MKKILASLLAVLMTASVMSFVASAQDTVTITFNRYNGQVNIAGGNVTNSGQFSTATVEKGTAITFPETPSYVRHTFVGWSTTENGEVIDLNEEHLAEADTTYYAVWNQTTIADTPLFEQNVSINKVNYMHGEGCGNITTLYDAENDIVFRRYRGSKTDDFNAYLNMYGLNTSDSIYTSQNSLYFKGLARANYQGATPTIAFYNTSNKLGKNTQYNSSSSTGTIAGNDGWKEQTITVTGLTNVGRVSHVAYRALGGKNIKKDDGKYFDVAYIYGFESEDAFNDYEPDASLKDVEVFFDVQIAGDDSDIYDEFPTDLENEGKALVGWSLTPDGEEIIDLTAVEVPTEETTYYAIWDNECTINFYKNDGTDAVETIKVGEGATFTVPEYAIDGKLFIGWATDAEGTELVEIPEKAERSIDYYAIWLDTWLTQIVVNGYDYNDAQKSGAFFGITDLNKAESLELVMPYGYPTSVIPTIVATASSGDAVYTAPATFDGEGSIALSDRTLPVTFTVADKSSVSDMISNVTSSVNSGGRGAYVIKNNTDKGISALKFVPIYSADSEYYQDGTYLPNRTTNAEGWGVFPAHNMESYAQYRMLVYYDTGADGVADFNVSPSLYVSDYHSRGTLKGKTIPKAQPYKFDRWEYIYFEVPEGTYTNTLQFAFQMMSGQNGEKFHDDVYYIAEVAALVDGDEKYLQYAPMGISATNETDAGNDGTISGVTADMEISVDGEDYVSVTEFDGYDAETGIISDLAPATYEVRYAGDDIFAPSEAVELTVAPNGVEISFEDGNDATNVVTMSYEFGAEIVLPASPVKAGYTFAGWALEDSEEAYDFEGVVADETLDGVTFYAIWDRVTTYYVDQATANAGDGTTAAAPLTSLVAAWDALAGVDGTIIVSGDYYLSDKFVGNGGRIVIKGADENAALHWVPDNRKTATFNRGVGGTIVFEDINFKYYTGNGWSFMNFEGLGYEFGEGFKIADGTDGNITYFSLRIRSGGEVGANYTLDGKKYIPVADKVVVRDGQKFGSFFLGGKGTGIIEDVYVENYGGNAYFAIGNDNGGGEVGTLSNIKVLLESTPKGLEIGNNCNGMTGAFRMIANNGVTTQAKLLNNIVPAGGSWIIYSGNGGRVDFTDANDTYKLTSDKTYAIVTDAEGNSAKYRMADGVTGDANLYSEDDVLELTLEAGTYTIEYTDDSVNVTAEFAVGDTVESVTLSKDVNYSAEVPAAIIDAAEAATPAGYIFSGEFASEDGAYETVDGVLTITEYTEETPVLVPVYVEDPSLAYYHGNAVYNEVLGTYEVTVSIANGKFTAGTVGITYDASVLEYVDYTLGDKASDNLGDAPAIVKEAAENAVVLVWDATGGVIDATNGDVDLVTFNFTAEEYSDALENAVSFYAIAEKEYQNYYEGGFYQAARPVEEGEDEYSVSYVDVYTSDINFKKAATDPATITVILSTPEKAGATVDDIAYLVYYPIGKDVDFYKYIALEEAGNDANEFEVEISDVFYSGETYNFFILKNGYTGTDIIEVTVEDGMTITAEIIGGDVKASFTGSDADAVDYDDFGDGEVTLSDFVRVVRGFDAAASAEYKSVVDINEDSIVNVTDLAIVKANYGKSFSDASISVSYNG